MLRLSMAVIVFCWPFAGLAATLEQQVCAGDQRCQCEVELLRPTQVAVGFLEVKKLVQRGEAALQLRAAEKPTEVVLGPNRVLYVVNGHHHARALSDLHVKQTWCRVDADLSIDATSGRTLDEAAFWEKMQDPAHPRVHLEDQNGRRVDVKDLPRNLASMPDDPYRSLAGWLAKACGYQNGDFEQFELADFLRSRVPVTQITEHKKRSVAAALPALKGVDAPAKYALKATDTCRQDTEQ